MILSIANNWNAARDEHSIFLEKLIHDFIVNQHTHQKFPFAASDFLLRIKSKLISCSAQDLLDCNNEFDKEVQNLGKLAEPLLIEPLKVLFNYDDFCKKKTSWDAYDLCKKSQIRTCPYCNQAFAFTLQPIPKGRGFRPTLDHFYDKARYPHLALALNNLIPSCSTCNSSLKNIINFNTEPHLNPLFDQENIRFSFSTTNPILLQKKIELGRITGLKIRASEVIPCEKTRNSLDTFMIEERYDMVMQEAIEFAASKIMYNDLKKEMILPIMFTNEQTILRFDRSKYKNYILGKLYADIYDLLS